MNCEQATRGLSFFLYGELSAGEEEALEQHLDICDGCRQALARERAMHAALDLDETAPPPELLTQCRQELRRGLRDVVAERRGWAAVRDWFPRGFLRPAAALTLLAAGFAAGRLIPTQETAPAAPVVTQVHDVRPDPGGSVRIVVDETRQRVFTGGPEDEAIRNLLLSAAREASDAGVRTQAIDFLVQKKEAGLAGVLQELLVTEDDNSVRLRCEKALRAMNASLETF